MSSNMAIITDTTLPGTKRRNRYRRKANKESHRSIFLIIHGQEGEGESKEAFLGKESAQVCGTQKMCPSLTLGFFLPQSCCMVMRRNAPL